MRCLALLAASAPIAAASVTSDTYSILLSDTLPGNLLPQFKFQLGAIEGGSLDVKLGGGPGDTNPYVPFDTAPDEIWDHASTDLRAPSMPYLLQDQWTCDREETDVPTIAYENDRLKLSITPQWGARIWSVYDKKMERDWTFANPAHQPANIGVLKSWSAGGIEFNWSPGIIGHSVFSESPAYVGILDTERGPVLRAYEYDRRNQSVWQADIWLPGAANDVKTADKKYEEDKGAPSSSATKKEEEDVKGAAVDDEDTGKLWIHPKVTNTQVDVDLEGYWWTCVAVPAAPSTRVVTPATWNLETSSDSSVGAPWPTFSMGNDNASFMPHASDNSFLEAIWSGDFFMGPLERGDSPVNYISYAEEGGFVGFHGHPLNGTKFFTWGQSGAGRFMQDFLGGLSGPEPAPARTGDYMELQVGPAFTQFQTFDLPQDTTLEWTEVFGAFQGDSTKLLSSDYSDAVGEVEGWLVGSDGVNDTAYLDTDAWLASISDTPLDSLLAFGSPWGAVEEIRREASSSSSLKAQAVPPSSSAGPAKSSSSGGGVLRSDRSVASDGSQLAPGLTFDHDAAYSNPETRPWAELASTGAFSADTLSSQPLSYQVGAEWLQLLQASETASNGNDGSTWLHDLHIATALTELGHVEEPRSRFASSLQKQALNPVAARNLAVLLSTPQEAWPFYQQAFSMALELSVPNNTTAWDDTDDGNGVAAVNIQAGQRLLVNLGSEMCALLQGASMWTELQMFIESEEFGAASALNPSLSTLDTVLLSQVFVKLRVAPTDPEGALAILGADGKAGCFPTFGKVRSVLMDLWFEAQQQIKEAQVGHSLLPVEARDNRIDFPVPRNIGCPYASWSGANKCTYW